MTYRPQEAFITIIPECQITYLIYYFIHVIKGANPVGIKQKNAKICILKSV